MKTQEPKTETRVPVEIQPSDKFELVTISNYAKRINKSRERVDQMYQESKLDIVTVSGVRFVKVEK